MSKENVELIRQGYEAFNSEQDLAAFAEFMHPEIESHDPLELPDPAVHRGREAVLRDFVATRDVFDDFRVVPKDLVDAGEVVLAVVQFSGRGTASGVDVELLVAQVWTFRDGQVIRLDQYLDIQKALEVVRLGSLSEQDVHADS
jgi:ketosteroid isomerase-like protein